MDTSVIVAIITGICSVAAIVLTNWASNKEVQGKIDKQQAVFEEHVTLEIGALKKEVEKHNSIVERVYSLENKATLMEEKMKVTSHRIDDLERRESNGSK